VLLSCGHASWYFDWDKKPASAVGYLFTCEQCSTEGQEVQRVLGAVRGEDFNQMNEDQVVAALFGAYAGR
jgi:hypothetical protein